MCSRERSAFKECIVVSRARKIFLKNNTPPSALLCLFETLSLLTRVGKHTREEETTQPREQKFKKKKKKERDFGRKITTLLLRIFCARHTFKRRPHNTLPKLPDAYTQKHQRFARRRQKTLLFLLFSSLRCCLCIKRLSSICHVSLEHASPFGKRWNEDVVVTNTERTKRSVASDAKRRCCNKSDAQF